MCLVILYYDYSLTFADEVARFWNRKNFTWASFLFFVNRYLVLLGNIPIMIEAFLQTSSFSKKTMVRLDSFILVRCGTNQSYRCSYS